jgi:DNA-binding HxlR family transcriptional regulator
MHQRKITEDLDCGITIAMKVFGAKWKPCIISAINHGAKRPSELHRQIPTATPRVIDMQLSELVEYGVVSKNIFPGLPLHVDYSLTSFGKSVLPIVDLMDDWGFKNKDHVKEVVNKLQSSFDS